MAQNMTYQRALGTLTAEMTGVQIALESAAENYTDPEILICRMTEIAARCQRAIDNVRALTA